MVQLLHEIPFQMFVDPELLAGSAVTSMSWSQDYPGRYFDGCLEKLTRSTPLGDLSLAECYRLLGDVGELDSPVYQQVVSRQSGVDSMEDLLSQREEVGSDQDFTRNGTRLVQNCVDRFASKTLAAWLHLRSADPTVTSRVLYGEIEPDDALGQVVSSLVVPPLSVVEDGLAGQASPAYAVETLLEFAVTELAGRGRLHMTHHLFRGVRKAFGESALERVDYYGRSNYPAIVTLHVIDLLAKGEA